MNNSAGAELRLRAFKGVVDRRSVSGSVPGWVLLAFVAYLVSAVIVRWFDYLGSHAQYEQLVVEAGPLVPVRCVGCVSNPALVLAWLTDGRVLLLWVLCVAGAEAAVFVSRLRPSA